MGYVCTGLNRDDREADDFLYENTDDNLASFCPLRIEWSEEGLLGAMHNIR